MERLQWAAVQPAGEAPPAPRAPERTAMTGGRAAPPQHAPAADGSLAHSRVFAFAYHAPAERTAFLRITSEGGGALKLTARHYTYALTPAQLAAELARGGGAGVVPLERWPYVEARHVAVGDYVPLSAAAGASGTATPSITCAGRDGRHAAGPAPAGPA